MTRRTNIENHVPNADIDPDVAHAAALTLAEHAADRAELERWMDMLGLNGREVRLSGRAAKYARTSA